MDTENAKNEEQHANIETNNKNTTEVQHSDEEHEPRDREEDDRRDVDTSYRRKYDDRGSYDYRSGPRYQRYRTDYTRRRYPQRRERGGYKKRRRDSISPERRPPKRRRQQQDVDEQQQFLIRLHTLLTTVGDKGPSDRIESQLENLSNVLLDDLNTHSDFILNVLIQCVMELSVKTPIYGTFVGLIHAKNSDFSLRVINEACTKLKEKFEIGDFMTCKLLVRFICELLNANVVPPEHVIQLLQNIMACTKRNLNPAQLDSYAYVVIASLPWCGRVLDDRRREDLSKLVNTIEDYMSKRDKKYLDMITLFGNQKEDYLEIMWQQLKSCKEQDWRVSSILKPYLAFESKLSKEKKNQDSLLKDFKIPELDPSTKLVHLCKGRLGLYESTEMDDDFKVSPIDKFVVEEYIGDTLYFYNINHQDCVTQLLNLPIRFQYEHLLIDVIFGHMLLLPKSPFRLVYYGVVLVNLCKEKSNNNVIPMIARYIDLLFEKADQLDIESYDRFAEWFAFHLSNFDYKWNWDIWKEVLSKSKNSKAYILLQEFANRILRLSYYDRVKEVFPSSFDEILPSEPKPVYKYSEDEKEVAALMDAIQDKKTPQELKTIVDESNIKEDKLEFVLNILLMYGSKSISHMIRMLERYGEVINHYKGKDERQTKLHIIKIVAQFWQKSPKQLMVTLDKMIKYNIIDTPAVCDWLCSKEMISKLSKPWIRECVRNTIDSAIGSVNRAFAELNQLKKQKEMNELLLQSTKQEEKKEEEKQEKASNEEKTSEEKKEEKKDEGEKKEEKKDEGEKKDNKDEMQVEKKEENKSEEKSEDDQINEKEKKFKSKINDLKDSLVMLFKNITNALQDFYSNSQNDDLWSACTLNFLKELLRKYQRYTPKLPKAEKLKDKIQNIYHLAKSVSYFATVPYGGNTVKEFGKLEDWIHFIHQNTADESDSDSE